MGPTFEKVGPTYRVKWNRCASVEGVDGAFDPADITYMVRRVSSNDNKRPIDTLAAGLAYADTVFEWTPTVFPDGFERFFFKVSTVYKGKYFDKFGTFAFPNSSTTLTSTVVWGSLTAPFSQLFWDMPTADAQSDMLAATKIDANNDGAKWSGGWSAILSPTGTKFYGTCFTSSKPRDDWYITVPIHVKANLTYTLKAHFAGKDTVNREAIEARVFDSPDVDPDAPVIFPLTEFKTDQFTTFSGKFKTTGDGVVYIGFHAYTTWAAGAIYMGGYEIDEGVAAGLPGEITDLVYTPDIEGTNKIDIAFKAPAVDVDGSALTALARVQVLRDSAVVKTFEAPAPATALSFTDEPAEEGYHTYSIVAFTEGGAGKPFEFKAYAGINVPAATASVTAAAKDGNAVSVSWQPVTNDVDGKAVKASNVAYNVYLEDSELFLKPVAEGVAGNSVETEVCAPGENAWGRVVVTAVTRGGESQRSGAPDNLWVGPALAMPWGESFHAGNYEGPFGWEVNGQWRISKKTNAIPATAADEDGGSISFVCDRDARLNWEGIVSPLIHVSGQEPCARFFSRIDAEAANSLRIDVNDGTGWTVVASKKQQDLLGTSANPYWGIIEGSLSDFKGKDVRVRFSTKGDYYTSTEFDNAQIYDKAQTTLGIQRLYADYGVVDPGQPSDVYVQVRNYGFQDVAEGSWNVELWRDGALVAQAQGPSLKPSYSATINLKDIVPASISKAHYTAKVVFAGDMAPSDNERSADIAVRPACLPAPRSLAASASHTVVDLEWNAPDMSEATGETLTENFENYDSWIYDNIGDWTMVDRDGTENQGSTICDMPIARKVTSFFVMDATLPGWVTPPYSSTPAYSGVKCLGSRHTDPADGDTHYQANDWAILPRLSGRAQTIRARVSNANQFLQAYASKTGKEIEDFELLPPFPLGSFNAEDQFTEIAFDVPDGTNYVAFHSGTPEGYGTFMVRVDDVRYTPALKEGAALGYNVYCDGVRVSQGDTPVTDTRYSHDSKTDGPHTYYVTSVYGNGESAPGNAVTLEVSALSVLDAAEAEEAGRYNAAGQKVGAGYRGPVVVRYSDGTARKTYNVK